jgi:trans-L-3-hydroxyproline dehydratase
VAQLYLRGELGKDETLINESIIGTIFKGRVLSETMVGDFKAVIPEVEGNAFICGFATWIVDERDPLTYGFLVR